MKNQFEEFLDEELENEAKRIMEEVEADESVRDVKATQEMHDELWSRIHAMEEEERIQSLSPETQEAIRLGREMQEKRKNRVHKKKWKAYILVAAVVALVCGISVTSLGGPEHVAEVVKNALAGRSRVAVTSDNENTKLLEGNSEEEVYQEIKDKLGFDAVRLGYLPDGMKFKDVEIYEDLQKVFIQYSKNDRKLIYRIKGNYKEESESIDIEDTLLQEYMIEQDNIDIFIREYEIKDTKEIQYIAEFYHNDIYYSISSIIEKDEFEKILKNLYFF